MANSETDAVINRVVKYGTCLLLTAIISRPRVL
jgi:hypothetical protein